MLQNSLFVYYISKIVSLNMQHWWEMMMIWTQVGGVNMEVVKLCVYIKDQVTRIHATVIQCDIDIYVFVCKWEIF